MQRWVTIVWLFAVAASAGAEALGPERAEELFRAATATELAERDPAAAIPLYATLIEKASDGLLRARARLHLAGCHEKLGEDDKALALYETLASAEESPPEIAEVARLRANRILHEKHLAMAPSSVTGPRFREISFRLAAGRSFPLADDFQPPNPFIDSLLSYWQGPRWGVGAQFVHSLEGRKSLVTASGKREVEHGAFYAGLASRRRFQYQRISMVISLGGGAAFERIVQRDQRRPVPNINPGVSEIDPPVGGVSKSYDISPTIAAEIEIQFKVSARSALVAGTQLFHLFRERQIVNAETAAESYRRLTILGPRVGFQLTF